MTSAPWFDLQFWPRLPALRASTTRQRVCLLCEPAVRLEPLYLSREQTYRGTCAVVYDPAHADST